ncbi:MAG TPA: LamG-like jellyroll fold domain-containing protein, partial [Candidatus Sulfotelmatobacter sp.]|nr:LamG-like jellyroll fold domain-containing protein [Candidatus Sulfotelmatobacter sp.]
HLQLPRPATMAGTFEQLTVMGDFQNVANLNVTTKAGIAYSSDNPAVATVSTNGVVQALSAGSAVLTVTLDGKSDSQTLTVTPVTAPLAHRYSFNTTPDYITTPDSVGGSAWDATMVGSYIMDNQLNLDGANSYATLPPGLVSNLSALTIETWASFGSLGNWCELYGFGNQLANGQGRNYMMMTPHSGSGDTRISIADSPAGDNHEQAVIIPGVLDNQTNVHIAAVYHPYAGFIALYLNGALAGINTNITIPLSSVIDNTNLLGYSIWAADSHINGSINEFRVYSGPRSAQQIAVDAAAGPDNLLDNPGTLQTVHLAVTNQMIVNLTQQAKVTGDFSALSGVNLFGYGQPVLVSGNTSVLTVTPTGLVKAVGPGTTTITATYGTFSDSKTITVSIPAPILAHRYSFNEAPDSWSVTDLVGGVNWDGMLPNGGTFTGTQLVLDSATGQHVQLPAGLIKGFYALTIETWASFRVNSAWCRLWDFGDQKTDLSGNTSVFFSPHDGNNGVRATIFNPNATDEVLASGNLDGQTNVHIVAV